jgi:hypothetical protein
MAGFFQQVLKGAVEGFFNDAYLRDFKHASKTFTTNGFENAPKFKWLFHVYFEFNPLFAGLYGQGNHGLLVKSISLPKFGVSVTEMNQYNRKRLVQTKINYNPATIVFNDDHSDLIRNMWYNYYTYYYKDPTQKYDNVAPTNGTLGNLATLANGYNYNDRDIYNNSRQVNDWGYIGEGYTDSSVFTGSNSSKPPFFRDIKIYGLSQKKFASYVLINPLINNWQHDTYDYAQGNGVMTHTVSLQYETVKYGTGYIGGNTPSSTVPGFADPNHYDNRRSALARPGSTDTVFGQGGLVDAGIGIYEDLEAILTGRGGLQNVIGAVQKAGTAYQTFKGKDIASIANQEAKQAAKEVLAASLPGATRQAVNAANGMIFPNPPKV